MSTSNFSVCLAEPVAKVQMWQTEARGEIVIRSTDYCTVCFTSAMPPTMTQPSLPTPLRVPDVRGKMAKADIRKADMDALYASLGKAMTEVMGAFCLSLKEFACEIGKDERQLQRQMDGKERPQIEAVFAVERFRGPMVIALARLAADVDVVTEIRVRRSA